MTTVLCLMGPTASGKTALAVELATSFPLDIISVDSALVYRDMNIGTAKPAADILDRAPHRLIDIRNPDETYSAADFCEDARREIEVIFKTKRIPLLVGGTMLYFRALQQGLAVLPSASASVREEILREAQLKGWGALHDELKRVDPLASARIHPNDPQRLTRALEVYRLTNKALTEHWDKPQPENTLQFINLALMPHDRQQLHQRIEHRFDEMLKQGFVDEVRRLREKYQLTPEMPSMRAVGYRQVLDYIAGVSSAVEMREKGIIATRQLAKRQMTWLRSWVGAEYFSEETVSTIKMRISQLLENHS